MQRNFSGWGVTVSGLLLVASGVYAMWTGWDMILLERGWSLFIAGAVAVSGGVVTAALGRVIAQIARLGPLAAADTIVARAEPRPAEVRPAEGVLPSASCRAASCRAALFRVASRGIVSRQIAFR